MNKLQASVTADVPDWVMMVHPDIPESYTLVTIAAFEEVYRDTGWVQADFSEDESVAAADAIASKADQKAPAEKAKE